MIQRSRLSNRNTYLRLDFSVISGVKFSFMGLKNEILQFDNEYRAIQCIWMGFVSVNGNITVEWPEFNEKRRFYFVIQDTRRWNESWRKDVASNGRGAARRDTNRVLFGYNGKKNYPLLLAHSNSRHEKLASHTKWQFQTFKCFTRLYKLSPMKDSMPFMEWSGNNNVNFGAVYSIWLIWCNSLTNIIKYNYERIHFRNFLLYKSFNWHRPRCIWINIQSLWLNLFLAPPEINEHFNRFDWFWNVRESKSISIGYCQSILFVFIQSQLIVPRNREKDVLIVAPA